MNHRVAFRCTSTGTGATQLELLDGAVNPFPLEQFEELRRQVQTQYNRLAERSQTNLRWKSYEFEVRRQATNGRLPALQIELIDPAPEFLLGNRAPPADWKAGFFAEIERLAEGPEPADAVAQMDRFALERTRQELRELATKGDAEGCLAAFLLAGYLVLARDLCRDNDPWRGNYYAHALRCLSGTLMDESGSWPNGVLGLVIENPPAAPKRSRARLVLKRLFRCLTRERN